MDQEKLFTQAEVDEIIKKRLARGKIDDDDLKERSASLEEREKQLADLQSTMAKREAQIDCKAYLQEQGYPLDLAEILDTSDVEAFKAKADKAFTITKSSGGSFAPGYNPETPPPKEDIAAKAFARDFKHTPKEKY